MIRRQRPERLPALAASAAAIRERTEPEFVELSGDLKALHEGAAELSRTTREQVTSVREVLGENRLTGAGGLADRSLEELRIELGEAGDKARMLGRSCEAMGRLRGYGRQMQRIASLLEVSGYGFAVESARTVASHQAFDTFVSELRKLASRVGTLGETITEQAERARSESEQLVRAMNASLGGLRELTAEAETAVRKTSERVEQALNNSWTALQDAEHHTARIATHAEDAVYHLQFGDIVRQKLEHVEAALAEALPEYRDQVLSVQAGQLDLVREEIASSQRMLEQAFAGLAEDTRLMADTAGKFAGHNEPSSGGDAIEELRAAFLRIDQLRQHGRELSSRAGDTSARAVETAGRLSRYVAEVEEINIAIHLQALNAIVKTALLGEAGRTLEILSMHVQRVFEESNGLVEETVRLIENISTMASGGAGARRDATEMNAELREGLDRLASVQSEFARAMGSAAAQTAEQESRLQSARVCLGFLTGMTQDVETLRRRIEDARMADVSLGTRSGQNGDSTVLRHRYTIASEREVHRRVTGTATQPPSETEVPGAGAPDDNNIDLFLDKPAPPAATAVEENLGDNVELF